MDDFEKEKLGEMERKFVMQDIKSAIGLMQNASRVIRDCSQIPYCDLLSDLLKNKADELINIYTTIKKAKYERKFKITGHGLVKRDWRDNCGKKESGE